MQRKKAPRRELPWDDVRLFLALCRARTIGAAAAALNVDGSTVSRRLVALEEALGATLFDRGREGVAPSKVAEDLMPVAEEMEAVMNRFTTTADALEREVAGLVRIACPADVAEVVVAPMIEELLARHPQLRIAIDPGETVVDLSRREADLALRTVRPTRGDLVVTRLATARWVLAATPELARDLGTLRTWSAAPWVSWGERLSNIGPARWLAKHAHDVEPIVRSDSLRLQLAVVARGVGVALVPQPSIEHYGLVPVKIAAGLRDDADAWPADELYLVMHRALRDVPRVRVVWDLLLERWSDSAKRRRSRA